VYKPQKPAATKSAAASRISAGSSGIKAATSGQCRVSVNIHNVYVAGVVVVATVAGVVAVSTPALGLFKKNRVSL
jgi:hypothetical protein